MNMYLKLKSKYRCSAGNQIHVVYFFIKMKMRIMHDFLAFIIQIGNSSYKQEEKVKRTVHIQDLMLTFHASSSFILKKKIVKYSCNTFLGVDLLCCCVDAARICESFRFPFSSIAHVPRGILY